MPFMPPLHAQRTDSGPMIVVAPHPEDRLGGALRATYHCEAGLPQDLAALLAQLDGTDAASH